MSDRIVVMNQGRVEQVGPPLEIYARPRNRFVADFIGKGNFLVGEAVGPGRVRVLDRVLAVDDLALRPPIFPCPVETSSDPLAGARQAIVTEPPLAQANL